MPSVDALKIVVDDETPPDWIYSFNDGALIPCIPGWLAFYHDHEFADSQFILARTATAWSLLSTSDRPDRQKVDAKTKGKACLS